MSDFHIGMVVSDKNRLSMMQKALSNHFKTHGYLTGTEFIKNSGKQEFDLLLIDFDLQDMSGKKLQEEILKRDKTVKTVMISALDRSRSSVESFKRRAMDYLYRTEDPDRFLEEICRLVRYVVDSRKRELAESLLKQTDLYPLLERLSSTRSMDLSQLKKEIDVYNRSKKETKA